MRWDYLAVLIALAVAGCSTAKRSEDFSASYPGGPVSAHPASKAKDKTAEVIVTPANSNLGRITAVNPGARFVVITFALGNVPGPNRRFSVYRTGLKVGEIKITGPARDNNTVADIMAGECQVNDEVKED